MTFVLVSPTSDQVMSRLKPFPAQKWPLILHLVMLSEDFDTQAMIERLWAVVLMGSSAKQRLMRFRIYQNLLSYTSTGNQMAKYQVDLQLFLYTHMHAIHQFI